MVITCMITMGTEKNDDTESFGSQWLLGIKTVYRR